jgi:hypothetical protein
MSPVFHSIFSAAGIPLLSKNAMLDDSDEHFHNKVQSRTLPKPESFDLFLWGIYCDAIIENNIHPSQALEQEMPAVVTAMNKEVLDRVLKNFQKLQLTILVLKGAHIKMLLHKLPSPSDSKYSHVLRITRFLDCVHRPEF